MPPDTVPEQPRAMPALWGYCTRVYTAMEEEATTAKLGSDEDLLGHVYEGHLTQLFRELTIPNPYYTSVTRTLKAMGCIHQLRRGGGPAPSRWLMIEPPKEEAFLTHESSGRTAVKHKGKVAAVEQRIRDLSNRVARLEDIVYNFLEAKDDDAASSETAGDGRESPQDSPDEERTG